MKDSNLNCKKTASPNNEKYTSRYILMLYNIDSETQ